jgi:hypothetical protein
VPIIIEEPSCLVREDLAIERLLKLSGLGLVSLAAAEREFGSHCHRVRIAGADH